MSRPAVTLCFALAAFGLAATSQVQAQTDAINSPEAVLYASSLIHAVERQLRFPKGSGGQKCQAVVTQDKTGEVVALQFKSCGSEKLRRAVETAVYLASPFPLPENPDVFNSHLELNFIVPEGT